MVNDTRVQSKKISLKNKVEAILFSVGTKISLRDICRLARNREDPVMEALQELKKEYEEKDTSLLIVQDGEFWKFAVRDQYSNIMRKIVTETELGKSVLETLAVIAFKYPIKQSDLIHIRTNKAYDHLKELQDTGFISRKKHGRTNLIKLTDKFFQYFDLPPDKLHEQFKDFESIAQAIAKKEEDIHNVKEEQQKEKVDSEAQEERIKKEIESMDDEEETVGLRTYGKKEDKIGDLEIFDDVQKSESTEKEVQGNAQHDQQTSPQEASSIPPVKIPPQDKVQPEQGQSTEMTEKTEEVIDEGKQTDTDMNEEKKSENPLQEPSEKKETSEQEHQKEEPPTGGIKVTPEMEKKINEKVEELLHPPKSSENESLENRQQEMMEKGLKKQDDKFELALEEAKKKKDESDEQ